jgi:hypothetical protein
MKKIFIATLAMAGTISLLSFLSLKANCPSSCTYGCGAIDNDPNTPYCIRANANNCCLEKPGGEIE